MLGSLACGVMVQQSGGTTSRYKYESVAIAAGPDMAGGAANPDVQAIAGTLRSALQTAGAALLYTIPCCAVASNGTYVPGCYLPQEDVRSFVTDPESTMVRTFDSSDALDSYIQTKDYGWHDTMPTIALAAVINRAADHPSRWSYVLRANSTDMPWTGTSLNTLTTGYKKSDFFNYYNNHMLTLQWVVESYMLSQAKKAAEPAVGPIEPATPELSAEDASAEKDGDEDGLATASSLFGAPLSPNGPMSFLPPGWRDMSFLSMPVPAHRQDNFKQYVTQVLGLFLVIAFMWPFSRMVRNMVEEKEMKLSEGVSHTRTRTTRTHTRMHAQPRRALFFLPRGFHPLMCCSFFFYSAACSLFLLFFLLLSSLFR